MGHAFKEPSMRGLPYGFHYCGCDNCCPDIEFEVVGGGGEAQKLERVKLAKPKGKLKCGEEMQRCYCEIFYRKRGGTHQWSWAHPDASGNVYRKGKRGDSDDHSDDEYEYKAFCVYLVLDDAADSTYWVCPCPCPTNVAPVEGDADTMDITCDEEGARCRTCNGKCQLFRIEKDKHTAKWEHIDSPAHTSKKDREKYAYKCLCVRE